MQEAYDISHDYSPLSLSLLPSISISDFEHLLPLTSIFIKRQYLLLYQYHTPHNLVSSPPPTPHTSIQNMADILAAFDALEKKEKAKKPIKSTNKKFVNPLKSSYAPLPLPYLLHPLVSAIPSDYISKIPTAPDLSAQDEHKQDHRAQATASSLQHHQAATVRPQSSPTAESPSYNFLTPFPPRAVFEFLQRQPLLPLASFGTPSSRNTASRSASGRLSAMMLSVRLNCPRGPS